MMLGMAKVVFSILLSGMMAIGRAMESGRRGYGSSSGWKCTRDNSPECEMGYRRMSLVNSGVKGVALLG
ncbi:hypothetical protein TNCV_1387981 [Trichonephila clavipes]|nr:hypothetical protein TNCV_1387981 [Trichonephila clavipes]